jgi:hypothetical protein
MPTGSMVRCARTGTSHRDADAARRRLERCLFQRHSADDEPQGATTRKAIIGPWATSIRISPCRAAHRRPAGDAALVGFLVAEEHQHRRDARSRLPLYLMDSYKPGTFPEDISGRWIADSFWGLARSTTAPGTSPPAALRRSRARKRTSRSHRSRPGFRWRRILHHLAWSGIPRRPAR